MTRDPLDLDLELELDVNFAPAERTYAHQISLPCYGRGKRFCDLRIPEIPTSFATSFNKTPSETAAKPCRGRGRSRRSYPRDEKEYRSLSPGGLQGAINVSTGSRSVCSDHSSRGSDNLQDAHQRDYDSSKQLILNEILTNASPQSPSSSSAIIKDGKEVLDSPPLKVHKGWNIHPPNVVQFEGIPVDYKLDDVYELLSSYSTIIDGEHKLADGNRSMRLKFNDAEACDLIETYMDKSDFTGTDCLVRCKHIRD